MHPHGGKLGGVARDGEELFPRFVDSSLPTGLYSIDRSELQNRARLRRCCRQDMNGGTGSGRRGKKREEKEKHTASGRIRYVVFLSYRELVLSERQLLIHVGFGLKKKKKNI